MFNYYYLDTSCTFMGMKYEEGLQIQPNCSTKCTCYKGEFHCETQSCLIDGHTCYAYGGIHYHTFDSQHYEFLGNCEYMFVQTCDTTEFSVVIISSIQNAYVSNIEMVKISVSSENLEILLGQGEGGTVTVNGTLRPNNGDEVILQSGEVELIRVGGHPHVVLKTSGIDLYWDGLSRLSVTVAQKWKGKLCGLCGNYNNDSMDDLQTRAGVLATSTTEFADSWQDNDTSQESCFSQSISQAACGASKTIEVVIRCDSLLGDDFSPCNTIVDPFPFIDACFYDDCICNEQSHENCYCNSLLTYAAICADHGIILPTQRNFNCCKYIESLKHLYKIFFHSCLPCGNDLSELWSIMPSNL